MLIGTGADAASTRFWEVTGITMKVVINAIAAAMTAIGLSIRLSVSLVIIRLNIFLFSLLGYEAVFEKGEVIC
jgi:hypothetical protein